MTWRARVRLAWTLAALVALGVRAWTGEDRGRWQVVGRGAWLDVSQHAGAWWTMRVDSAGRMLYPVVRIDCATGALAGTRNPQAVRAKHATVHAACHRPTSRPPR